MTQDESGGHALSGLSLRTYFQALARKPAPGPRTVQSIIEAHSTRMLAGYAADLRFLLHVALRTEQMQELLAEPGLPELRTILDRIRQTEEKAEIPKECRL
jgi:hypothetical protein